MKTGKGMIMHTCRECYWYTDHYCRLRRLKVDGEEDACHIRFALKNPKCVECGKELKPTKVFPWHYARETKAWLKRHRYEGIELHEDGECLVYCLAHYPKWLEKALKRDAIYERTMRE